MSATARRECPGLMLNQVRDLRVAAELRRVLENEFQNRNFDPNFEAQSYVLDTIQNLEERVRRERR